MFVCGAMYVEIYTLKDNPVRKVKEHHKKKTS